MDYMTKRQVVVTLAGRTGELDCVQLTVTLTLTTDVQNAGTLLDSAADCVVSYLNNRTVLDPGVPLYSGQAVQPKNALRWLDFLYTVDVRGGDVCSAIATYVYGYANTLYDDETLETFGGLIQITIERKIDG